ncbi:hypothetical protein HYS84_02675 [Candidatus Saccharibacteria bacterium]|nr:hypothetical protein [Candidatus Saccharibacteria bacterium]
MPETTPAVEDTTQPEFYCDLLNVDRQKLLRTAAKIQNSVEALDGYGTSLKAFRDLQEYLDFCIGQIMLSTGRNKRSIASHFFEMGSLMMFGLLHKLALAGDKKIPEVNLPKAAYPAIWPKPPAGPIPEDIWTMDYCWRGMLMPIRYPDFFDASLMMLSLATYDKPEKLRELLLADAGVGLNATAFRTVNFLSGSTEVLVALEWGGLEGATGTWQVAGLSQN